MSLVSDLASNLVSQSASRFALSLLKAREAGSARSPLTKDFVELEGKENARKPEDLRTAYGIQREFVRLQNSQVLGYKMGFTSKAKMEQMGLFAPIMGMLTKDSCVLGDSPLLLTKLIHPKIELEIVFKLKKSPVPRMTKDDAASCIDKFGVALEVLDSRYENFKYFSLYDVIADNASAALFVVPKELVDFKGENVSQMDLSLKLNDKKFEAKASEILGDPLNSLIELGNLMESFEFASLKPGSLVLAGSAITAQELDKYQSPKCIATLSLDGKKLSSLGEL